MWMKRVIWLVMGVCVGASGARAQGLSWDFAGLLGTVTVDQSQWQRLDLQPNLRIGAFEMVLDLELFLDETGEIRDRGWDFSTRRKGFESVLRKIHYVSYGRPNDPDRRVYIRLGALESVTLGSGLLMRNYRNTLDAPSIKRTGLDVQFQRAMAGRVSIRMMVSDLLGLYGGGPIVAGRMVFHPADQWDIGATMVMDADQLNALPDSVRAEYPRDAYGAVSVDVNYPLMLRRGMQVTLYGAIARGLSSDSGVGLSVPGIRIQAGGLGVQGEYRWVTGRFQPGHFDALYDLNRVVVDPATGAVLTREAALDDVSMHGVFVDVVLPLGRLLRAGGAYQMLRGGGGDAQILEGRMALSEEALARLPRVDMAEAYYEKRLNRSDLGALFDGTPDVRFGYRLGIVPLSQVTIVWEVEFTYAPDGLGGFRRRRTLNLQSRMSF